MAFGRGSVIHGALSTGKLSNRVVEEATKLRGLREIDGDDMVAGKDKEARLVIMTAKRHSVWAVRAQAM